MIITKIERQKRDIHRVNVYIDGEFGFGIHDDVLVKCGFRKGDTLTREQIDKVALSEEADRAKRQSLRFIGYRMRSEKELRTKLIQKEFPPGIIEKTIEHLGALGLVNDVEFARLFVHDQQLRRPAGRRLITQKLRLKGISDAVIGQVLSENTDPEGEHAAALAAAKKHLKRRTLPGNTTERLKEQQRIAQFLSRRGFDWPTIEPVIRILFPSGSRHYEEA